MSTATKTIRVRKDTYDDLSKQGSFGDSFDEVIQRLLLGKKEGAGRTNG